MESLGKVVVENTELNSLLAVPRLQSPTLAAVPASVHIKRRSSALWKRVIVYAVMLRRFHGRREADIVRLAETVALHGRRVRPSVRATV